MSVSDIINQTLLRSAHEKTPNSAIDLFTNQNAVDSGNSYQSALRKSLDSSSRSQQTTEPQNRTTGVESRDHRPEPTPNSQSETQRASSSDRDSGAPDSTSRPEKRQAEESRNVSSDSEKTSPDHSSEQTSASNESTESTSTVQADENAAALSEETTSEQSEQEQLNSPIVVDLGPQEVAEELPVMPASLSAQLHSDSEQSQSSLTSELAQTQTTETEEVLKPPASLLQIQDLLAEANGELNSEGENTEEPASSELSIETDPLPEETGPTGVETSELSLEQNQDSDLVDGVTPSEATTDQLEISLNQSQTNSKSEQTQSEQDNVPAESNVVPEEQALEVSELTSPVAESDATTQVESVEATSGEELEADEAVLKAQPDEQSEGEQEEGNQEQEHKNSIPVNSESSTPDFSRNSSDQNPTQSAEANQKVDNEENATAAASTEPVVTNVTNATTTEETTSSTTDSNQSEERGSSTSSTQRKEPQPQVGAGPQTINAETKSDGITAEGTPEVAVSANQAAPTSKESSPSRAANQSGGLPAADSAEFMERLTELVQSAEAGDQKLQVRLTPPQLGSLNIEVTKVDGVVTAKLEVQSAAAQQVLLEHLTGLKESLSQQGNVVERIEIQVQEPGRSEQGQNQSSEQQRDSQNQREQKQNNEQQSQQSDQSEETSSESSEESSNENQSSLIDNLDVQI